MAARHVRELSRSQLLSNLGRVNKFPYPVRVGTDICNVPTIKTLLTKDDGKYAERFYKRILNESEYRDFQNRVAQQGEAAGFEFIAGRWAAKEAVMKAATPTRLAFRDITIRSASINPDPKRSKNNKPPVAVVQLYPNQAPFEIPLSISHHADYAIATCVGFDLVEKTRQGLQEIWDQALPQDKVLLREDKFQPFSKSDREELAKLLSYAAGLDSKGLKAACQMLRTWKDVIETERSDYLNARKQNLRRIIEVKTQALKTALWVNTTERSEEMKNLGKLLQRTRADNRGNVVRDYVTQQHRREIEQLTGDQRSWSSVWQMMKQSPPPEEQPSSILAEFGHEAEARQLSRMLRSINSNEQENRPQALEAETQAAAGSGLFLETEPSGKIELPASPREAVATNDMPSSSYELLLQELRALRSQVSDLAADRGSLIQASKITLELKSLKAQLDEVKAAMPLPGHVQPGLSGESGLRLQESFSMNKVSTTKEALSKWPVASIAEQGMEDAKRAVAPTTSISNVESVTETNDTPPISSEKPKKRGKPGERQQNHNNPRVERYWAGINAKRFSKREGELLAKKRLENQALEEALATADVQIAGRATVGTAEVNKDEKAQNAAEQNHESATTYAPNRWDAAKKAMRIYLEDPTSDLSETAAKTSKESNRTQGTRHSESSVEQGGLRSQSTSLGARSLEQQDVRQSRIPSSATAGI